MGDTTDDLIALAKQLHPDPPERELALLLSTGEVVSCALLAMALQAMGYRAMALTGFQAGIRTTTRHSRAQILEIRPQRMQAALDRGEIVIVAGYQGWTEEMDISVLGRGGSDTTAVAVAVALGADWCEFYKDVEGIMTADPRLVPAAQKLETITYEEMLEMARSGAQVLHPRAVELADVNNLPLVVRSSFTDAPGTRILRSEEMPLEGRQRVRSIVHDQDVGRITLVGIPDRPGIAYAIFRPLEEAAVNVDLIVQNVGHDNATDLSFTVSRNDLAKTLCLVEPVARMLGAREVQSSTDLVKLSIVGAGLISTPGYAARMFGALAKEEINIYSITTSEIRITCLIKETDLERGARALHRTFLEGRP